MLVRLKTENKNLDSQYHNEVYVNPSHIAVAQKKLVGSDIHFRVETVGGMLWEVDEDGYNRIVEWMERQDG